MDTYETSRIYNAPLNLMMDEERIPNMTKDEIIKAFKYLIRDFKLGNTYIYRDQLQSNVLKEKYYVEFNYDDINSTNENLANLLTYRPAENVPLFEKALREVCFESQVKFNSIDEVPDMQFILINTSNPKSLREINSANVNQLIVLSGIIVSATKPSIKANKLAVQCRNCGHIKMLTLNSGFTKISIPRTCDKSVNIIDNKEKCPLDSYQIIPESSLCIDTQTLKLQETPEMIPTGEIPRSYTLYCDRYLVNKVTPGTRVNIVGTLSVNDYKHESEHVRTNYIRVLGFQLETTKTGKHTFNFSQEDEQKFMNYAKDPQIYEKISKSIASAIYGSEDVKKAIACLLFGGCRKSIREGVNLRGDINILLLGDPSTAKSQFLKFAERVAPIAIYTSGKGSSAAGLTASIIRDPSSGEFQLEGGAMVLADGGIVCIDEFDKMRPQDRVAIHEAMEQQTISVAKAGITTTLNSRTSVLAAANPIYGRLDDLKSTQDQIDFQTTILSRFDCIFLVKDVRDVSRDTALANYIIDLQISGKPNEISRNEAEISIIDLKKFIAYARYKCTPKISDQAGKLLANFYVSDRKKVNDKKSGQKGKSNIPVTVRQLEAIIRLSEAIAKMSLSNTVSESHVHEAHRLFQISTLSAANSDFKTLYDVPSDLAPQIIRIEEAIRRRLAIGAKIPYAKMIEELTLRYTSHKAIEYAIINMIRRDELNFLESRKIVQRKK